MEEECSISYNDGSIIKGDISLGYITKEQYDNYLNKLQHKGED